MHSPEGTPLQVFDEATVRKLLTMESLIPAMSDALRLLSAGEVVQPVRVVVPVADHAGFLGSMPAYAGGHLGAKLVTFYPNNKNIHTHHAVIVLFSVNDGQPMVMMDGRLITEMRTAAASAVATQVLARTDASVLGIIGTGAQARSHLEAIRLVRNIREVRVWSPRNAAAFAKEFGVTAAGTAEEAVRGADIIVVASGSKTPVLNGEWLSPGAHVNAVGATRHDWRELDDAVLQRAKLYVDSRDAASQESGDVKASRGIFAEIGEVVGGKRPGRESNDEITLFKSVGVAVEDIASAALVWNRANALGVTG